jgi:hypothetical protein
MLVQTKMGGGLFRVRARQCPGLDRVFRKTSTYFCRPNFEKAIFFVKFTFQVGDLVSASGRKNAKVNSSVRQLSTKVRSFLRVMGFCFAVIFFHIRSAVQETTDACLSEGDLWPLQE